MLRRHFLLAGPMALGAAPAGLAPIEETHFPSRLHQFVWRNWELANLDAMARTVGARAADLAAIGASMGLPPKRPLTADQLRRIYISTIRQNWHVLPNEQIVALLGWTRERFEFTLKEDDFLDVKLSRKPDCEPLAYHEPTAAERVQAKQMAAALDEVFGGALRAPGEEAFAFVGELSRPSGRRAAPRPGKQVWNPRYLYSYFALYGDPLMDPSIDPIPDGYLEKLAAVGINGVWMQAVLNTLAPSKHFPEFGAGSDQRLRRLNELAARAAKHGMKIFLYLNEPRAMPGAFFEKREAMRGAPEKNVFCMCTSAPEVREWMADSLAHVFARVPALGGVFSITMSENLTNCFSHAGGWGVKPPIAKNCPRCSKRDSWDVLAELLTTFRDGVRRSSKDAHVIAWDWGWPMDMTAKLLPKLPRDVKFMSISEWDQPLERGGVKTKVGEYSISVVGPGPRAKANWKVARESGIATMAKLQFNNTWEISAVPYVPVPPLILQHCAGLAKEGISGIMPSWTCGGYPSPNLDAAQAYYYEPRPSDDEILKDVATRWYGANAASGVVAAWKRFSEAYTEYPYGVSMYLIPTQHGPANLLRWKPSGHRPGMILFPHDALKAWCGAYPPEAVQAQFTRMAGMWNDGVEMLKKALAGAAPAHRRQAGIALAVAETCGNHFQSVANQVEFYRLRDTNGSRRRMKELVEAEMMLARAQFDVARRCSLVAYEASNHYYYRPLDLAEKVLNCRAVIDSMARGR